jgi:hypothetical protein
MPRTALGVAAGARECSIAKTPAMGRPWRGFCARHAEESLSLYFPHPSHDSQLMSRLATTITMLVMSTAKQENSRRSLTRKRILAPSLCLPVQRPC